VIAGNGWDASASAWIAEQGELGDFGRRAVLDRPMLARLERRRFEKALDVGCGEGRFCRMLAARGIAAIGIDPTAALLAEARRRDPAGDYRAGRAERLDFEASSFDLVVSYLTLVDIADFRAAISEMARVLQPGGSVLVANLTSFNTAGQPRGWAAAGNEEPYFAIDHYMEERSIEVAWRDVRIINHHRPLAAYMRAFLGEGLELAWFDEPMPHQGEPHRIALHRRVPYFVAMEWRKPR
jgi:SAM-dependent methyltransferase